MAAHKHIDLVCAAAALLALVFTAGLFAAAPTAVQAMGQVMGYEDRLFDTTRVHTIDIVMDDWDGFLETCENEEYTACSVIIDGEACQNVGLRAKGNTSLSQVSAMDSDRYSFKVEFDQYEKGKSYHGLDKLCLNNLIQDATMMKDCLSYRLMAAFGVAAPLCSFAYLTVNGEDWGLYLAVEAVEESFLQRNYGSSYGQLYKPDSMSMGAGPGNGRDFDMEEFADREEDGAANAEPFGRQRPSGFPQMDGVDAAGQRPEDGQGRGGMDGGRGSSDVKLQYIDDDPDSYANIFDSAKTETTAADEKRLIASLKSLSAYEDLENVLDTDQVLRYFVVQNFLVNGDSYTGSMIHNYYLYEEAGRLSMLPWDYNLAFGGFAGGAASAVNDPIDDVLEDRPMQAWIFSDDTYTQRYHDLYREFLSTVDVQEMIEQIRTLIAPYVERDPTKFYTREEFEAGADALEVFCALREQSTLGQLEGSIPSTSQGQSEDSSALVDTDGLELSAMGTMNTGRGMGGAAAVGGFGGGLNGQPPSPPDLSGESDVPDSGQAPSRDAMSAVHRPDGNRGGSFSPDGPGSPGTSLSPAAIVLLSAMLVLLAAGLLFAKRYRRRGK